MTPTPDQQPLLPQVGDHINQRYHVIDILGKGGGGQVFKVHDDWQHRDVALKYLLNPSNRPNALQRFQDEFFKLKQFPHPNIGAGYDFELDRQRTLHFFTTELIVGQNLLDAAATLTPLEVEALVVQALRALMFLHNNEFNHFDIKPPNVLVAQDSKGHRIAKLIDFGVSDFGFKGKLVGTASYMAPEMTTRDFPDRRADLYSLGVTWFHALARHNPYRGENQEESKKRHFGPVPDLSQYNAKACQQCSYLNEIIKKLLRIERDERFQSAEAVIREINLHKEKAHQYEVETEETRRSYLPTQSRFVGRHDIIKGVRAFLKAHQYDDTQPEFSAGPDIMLITGESGSGKTRLLEEMCKLAQPNGFITYGATIHNPAALDRLREKINEAIDNPSHSILIWIDDYEQSAISDDVMKLRDHLLRWRALNAKPLRTGLVISGTSIEKFQNQQRTEIRLEPFTAAELQEYVVAVTGFEDPPKGFVHELWNYTEGRPRMVTSLMRALLDQGYLLDKAGRWKASTFEDLGVDFTSLQIPQDMVGAIEEDYKKLDKDEITTLAAIVAWRRPTPLENIEFLLKKPIPISIQNSLFLKGWLGFEEGKMGILNPVRRDIILQHANRQQLSQWYDQIVTVLKKTPDAEPEDIFWYESHGSNSKKALQSKWQLAQHYATTRRHLLAVQILEELLKNDPGSVQFDASIVLARSLRNLHQYEQAMAVLVNLRPAAITPAQLATLWEEMAITSLRRRAYPMAEQFCEKGLRVVEEELKDEVRRLRLKNWQGQIYLNRGNDQKNKLADAIELFRDTFRSAQKLPVDMRIQITNNDLCKALYQKGLYKELLVYVDTAMQLCKEAGETGRYLRNNYYKCEALRFTGNYKEAENQYKDIEDAVRKFQDRDCLFLFYQGFGNIYSTQNQHEKAIARYERAMEVGGRLEDNNQVVVVTINMGIEHNQYAKELSATDGIKCQKHQREAERILLSALDYLQTNLESWAGRPYYICRTQLELGDLYYRMSQFPKAYLHLDEAEKTANGNDITKQFLFWIKLTRGEAYLAEGKSIVATQIFNLLEPEVGKDLDRKAALEAARRSTH